jgi:dihydroneopterin aldolase
LGEAIPDEILKDFPLVNKVKVKVHKPDAPINLEFSDVIVSIEKQR